MASTINDELEALVEDFEMLDDWEDRYRHILDLGRGLAPLSEAEHSDDRKVPGCASQVWLVTEAGPERTLVFRGDSDAHLVRGLIAVLLDSVLRPHAGRDQRLRRRGCVSAAGFGRRPDQPARQRPARHGRPHPGGGPRRGLGGSVQAARMPETARSAPAPTGAS